MITTKRNHPRVNNIDVLLKLTKRNFLVFTRSKIRMFYTLMVPVIMLIIYILFLRRLEFDSISKAIKGVDEKALLTLIDSWFLSGVVALSTISISLQTNNLIINDKENGINRDFASAPVHKTVITLSYIIFNFLITFILCFAFVLITFIYLGIMGEMLITFVDSLRIIGLLAFTCLNASFFTTLICSFINRETTLASVIAIVSACLGFLIGSFMPMSLMPKIVQDLCFFIPGTHATALMRFAYLSTPLDHYQTLVSPENFEILKNQVGFNIIFYVKDMYAEVNLSIDPIKQGGVIIRPLYQGLIVSFYTILFAFLNFFSRKNTVRTNIK